MVAIPLNFGKETRSYSCFTSIKSFSVTYIEQNFSINGPFPQSWIFYIFVHRISTYALNNGIFFTIAWYIKDATLSNLIHIAYGYSFEELSKAVWEISLENTLNNRNTWKWNIFNWCCDCTLSYDYGWRIPFVPHIRYKICG